MKNIAARSKITYIDTESQMAKYHHSMDGVHVKKDFLGVFASIIISGLGRRSNIQRNRPPRMQLRNQNYAVQRDFADRVHSSAASATTTAAPVHSSAESATTTTAHIPLPAKNPDPSQPHVHGYPTVINTPQIPASVSDHGFYPLPNCGSQQMSQYSNSNMVQSQDNAGYGYPSYVNMYSNQGYPAQQYLPR